MVNKLIAYERHLKDILASKEKTIDWDHEAAIYIRKVAEFQHERLIHLIVTMTVGICLCMSYFFLMMIQRIELLVIPVMLTALFIPYIFHYYKLENGIQRLYLLGDKLDKRKEK